MKNWGIPKNKFACLLTGFGLCLSIFGCSGKYLIKTYPAGAKVYLRDIKSNEKKLVGLSPAQIKEESGLGDVFFLVFEKQNYKEKEVMIRVNPGESLTVAAQLDPMINDGTTTDGKNGADSGKKDNEDKPPPGQPKSDEKKAEMEKLKEEIADLNLRVALLENTTVLYKDAIFSARFQGGPAKFDRDRNDNVIGYMFQAQQAIAGNQLGKAIALIDKAIELDEYVSQAWLLKGSVKYLQKDYSSARSAWERSLKLDPYNKIAFKYLNEVYKRMGDSPLVAPPADLRTPSSVLDINKRKNTKAEKN